MSERLKRAGLAGGTVTLKLKSARFHTRTRSRQLAAPTQLADVLYRAALLLLAREADGTAFRLIGIGASGLAGAEAADPPDLFDPAAAKRARSEKAVDAVRAKLGAGAIGKGHALAGDGR